MNNIIYIDGDATEPINIKTNKFITHICNDKGGWGRGFVLALSKKWKEPETEYRNWAKEKDKENSSFKLGGVQFVNVGKKEDSHTLHIANMIAQHDTVEIDNVPPIRYEALRSCLKKVNQMALLANATIHMPRIGAGLAGGDWSIIENIIREELKNCIVFVYDFDEK